jgi:hypothetical protein
VAHAQDQDRITEDGINNPVIAHPDPFQRNAGHAGGLTIALWLSEFEER